MVSGGVEEVALEASIADLRQQACIYNSIMQCNAMQCNTIRYNTIQYNAWRRWR